MTTIPSQQLIGQLKAHQISKSGYGGITPNGNIVDRRERPEAIPIQANKMLGVPKPKKIQGTLFETEKQQLLMHGVMGSCLDASSAKVRDFTIRKVDYKTCVSFCQIWHYSKSCPAGKAYFGLFYGENIIGVICYGEPAMRNQKGCYDADIELRRLCCIDLTPKNTESYFIGNTLKAIKKMGFKRCISLADPNFGHKGTIYKASNFQYLGREQGGGSRDIFIDGEKMHSRTAFAKFGASGYAGLKALFPDKEIKVMDKERKHVFVYDFHNCP